MFIVVLFGYKMNKIFTIDLLTATLMDYIWNLCHKDVQKKLQQAEENHNKEVTILTKKQDRLKNKLEDIEGKIAAEEEENKEQNEEKGAKSKPKPKAAPAKKGKEVAPTNPLEQEKLDVTNELDKIANYLEKYSQKLELIKQQKEKYQEVERNQNIVREICDKTGERKFVKTKLDVEANTIFTDKNTYVLGYYLPKQDQIDEDEVIEPLQIDGFSVRTCEEDVDAVEEILIPKIDEKDKKKKAQKKK